MAYSAPYGRISYVEIVELGNPILGDQLRDRRIPFRNPSEELWDTHDCAVFGLLVVGVG